MIPIAVHLYQQISDEPVENKVLTTEIICMIFTNCIVSFHEIANRFSPRGFSNIEISKCISRLISRSMIEETEELKFRITPYIYLILEELYEQNTEDLASYKLPVESPGR